MGRENKLYETFFDSEPSFKESCCRIDNAVREIEDSYFGTLQKAEIELISDKFMGIVSDARREGFAAGVKFAIKLIFRFVSN